MRCPKCDSKAICVDTESFRFKAGEPLTTIRTYACTNYACLEGFVYRDTYVKPTDRLDVKKFIQRYKRELEDKRQGQIKLELEDEEKQS